MVYTVNSDRHVILAYTVKKVIIANGITFEAKSGSQLLTFSVNDIGKTVFTSSDDVKRVLTTLHKNAQDFSN